MPENQNVEYKESWRDEYLKWICGFANAQGGKIYIGVNDQGDVVGVKDSKKLMEDIPNKIQSGLSIVADVNLPKKDGKDYIEIIRIISSHTVHLKERYKFVLQQLDFFSSSDFIQNSYCRKYYGKKLTCTNRKGWSTEQILKGYGEQECIEINIFRVSKDTDHFSVRPQYHWTDDKIRVHTFICLWAIIISEMLKIEFEKDDMKMTKAAMLDKLSTIRDGWLFENDKKVKKSTGAYEWRSAENVGDRSEISHLINRQ